MLINISCIDVSDNNNDRFSMMLFDSDISFRENVALKGQHVFQNS